MVENESPVMENVFESTPVMCVPSAANTQATKALAGGTEHCAASVLEVSFDEALTHIRESWTCSSSSRSCASRQTANKDHTLSACKPDEEREKVEYWYPVP